MNVGKNGVSLQGQSRELVCKVRDYFDRERINKGLLFPVEQVVIRTAAALNINKRIKAKIVQEKKQNEASGSKLQTPNKKIVKTKRVTSLDAIQKDTIRRHVYAYFSRKEYPTVKKLLVSLTEADVFHGSKSSLAIVLKRLGFNYKKVCNRKCLMERGDIIASGGLRR